MIGRTLREEITGKLEEFIPLTEKDVTFEMCIDEIMEIIGDSLIRFAKNKEIKL